MLSRVYPSGSVRKAFCLYCGQNEPRSRYINSTRFEAHPFATQEDQLGNIAARVHREAEHYDGSKLRREGYEKALAYLNNGVGKLRRAEKIELAMRLAHEKRVLEIGSQSWEWFLHRYGYQPKRLVCINISESELENGRCQAEKLGVIAEFCQMDAHFLQFSDASFDMVFGEAILHHLEFTQALREVHRVLEIGGKIFFVEPLRHNPFARLTRLLTPHARTPDEQPLGRRELSLLDRNFQLQNYYSELFTVLGSLLTHPIFRKPVNPITRMCDTIDTALQRLVPSTAPYFRCVIVQGTKLSDTWRD